MPGKTSFEVWGRDAEKDDKEAVLQKSFGSPEEAEDYAGILRDLGLTDVDIKPIHACPKCGTNMIPDLSEPDQDYWKCPKCGNMEPAEMEVKP